MPRRTDETEPQSDPDASLSTDPATSPAAADPTRSVRDRLLDAALFEFAHHGYGGGSLRRLTQRAGVALGNVRHVFGSKQALLDALLESIWGPCTVRRLESLDALEARAEPPTAVEVFDASAEPVVEILSSERGVLVGMFLAHASVEHEAFWPAVERTLSQLGSRFPEACARALPQLPKEEVFYRWQKTMQSFFTWLTPTGQHVVIPAPMSEREIERCRSYAIGILTGPTMEERGLPAPPWAGRLGG